MKSSHRKLEACYYKEKGARHGFTVLLMARPLGRARG
jgi:hypothetical protein